jgi:hypothetical protein
MYENNQEMLNYDSTLKIGTSNTDQKIVLALLLPGTFCFADSDRVG